MAKYWTSSKNWTTTINSSTRYLVGSSGGKCNYQTISAGGTKRILQSNGGNGNIFYGNLTVPVPSGSKTFTSSQTWTVPAGVTKVTVFLVGGGGSGAFSDSIGGGGGGAGYTKTATVNTTPGSSISVTVGSGGGARTSWGNGNNGGTSSFGSLCSVGGGQGAQSPLDNDNMGWPRGGNGGSGGGSGMWVDIYTSASYGGSDGSDGDYWKNDNGVRLDGGSGQGTTTRAWGQSGQTLYAGGGGGGGTGNASNPTRGGAGGDGGGGKGGGYASAGTNGTANTGGGGGGTGREAWNKASGAGGSGIVLIKWG